MCNNDGTTQIRVTFFLPDNLLGLTFGETIRIDVDAAGYGWHIEKYKGQRTKNKVGITEDEAIVTIPHSAFRIPHSVDLLTVVLHELGHVLGLDHHDAGLMDDTLTLGTRRRWDEEFDVSNSEHDDASLLARPPNDGVIDAVFASM